MRLSIKLVAPDARRSAIVATFVAVTVALLAAASPVSASSHDVELGIVFTDEQNCVNGTDRLISAAFPFDVEACFTEGGSPISGLDVYLEVTHGDGEVERLDAVTDAEGRAFFTVTPTSAGLTTAVICDAEGCYDSVELSSENPPPPPVVPFAPGGGDIGQTEEVSDAPLDMINPESGAAAGPEASSAHDGVDIAAFSYSGIDNGRATFKIRMVGNGRTLYDSGPPRWDMTIRVTTPEGTSYSLSVRNSEGKFAANAHNGAEEITSNAAIELTWSEDGHTACVSAAGVDVPPGSTVTIFAAASLDPESSGIYDEVTAIVVAGDPTESDDPGTIDDGSKTGTIDDGSKTGQDDGSKTGQDDTRQDGTEDPATTPNTTGSDSGGLPIVPLAIGALGLLGGFAWWRSQHEPTSATGTAPAATSRSDPADDFISAFFSLGAPSSTTTNGQTDEQSSELWAQASSAEARVQEQIESAVRETLEPALEAYREYLEAVEKFREKFIKVMSASTELQGMVQQWAEVQEIAQKQDIAFAIVSLVISGGTGAAKLSGWMNRATHVPWHRSTLTGRMLASGGKAPARAGAAVLGGRGAVRLTDDVAEGAAHAPTPAVVKAADSQTFIRQYYSQHYSAAGGQHGVVIHGTKNGGFVVQRSADAAWLPTTVEKVATQVRKSGWRQGQPIELMSCHSGSNGTASALAKQLHTWVVAPTKQLMIVQPGRGAWYKEHAANGFYRAFDPDGVLQYVNYGFGWMKLP